MSKAALSNLNFQTATPIVFGTLSIANCAYGVSKGSWPSVIYSVLLAAAAYLGNSSPKAGALLSAALLARFSWSIGRKSESQKSPDLGVISAALFCSAVYCAYRGSQL